MREISLEVLEVLIRNVMEKTGKSEEDVRTAVLAVLSENGMVVAREPEVDMALLSAQAGEAVVVENLRRMNEGAPHLGHDALLRAIRAHQVNTKEKAVIAKLRARGVRV